MINPECSYFDYGKRDVFMAILVDMRMAIFVYKHDNYLAINRGQIMPCLPTKLAMVATKTFVLRWPNLEHSELISVLFLFFF